MTPNSKRRFNISMGSLFILAGLISTGAGFFAATVPAAPRPAPIAQAAGVDKEGCRVALSQMGYSAILQSDEIRAVSLTLENPEEQLIKATAAISMCRLKMKEFCMGESCPQPNTLSFTLVNENQAK